jgi:hypothetical protein
MYYVKWMLFVGIQIKINSWDDNAAAADDVDDNNSRKPFFYVNYD